MTNCPNCGAIITSHKCEYCGTLFEHKLSDIDRLRMENEALNRQILVEQSFLEAISAIRKCAKIERRF